MIILKDDSVQGYKYKNTQGVEKSAAVENLATHGC